ncbi:MAG: UDP-glucose 4-epimerase GalE [Patescibacteria group bacterium]
MKILVTGGAGYIGSVLTAKLLDSGHEVIVLDSLVNGHLEAVDSRAKFVSGDIGGIVLLKKIFKENPGIDAVAHLAGFIEVSESIKDPEKYLNNNYEKPKVLISEMLSAGVKNIIFSSTAAVYGVPETDLITEEQTTQPINAYGESKLKLEQFLNSQISNGLNPVSLRFFNASGATAEHGEMHNPETHLIPSLIKCIIEGKEAQVFGTDYETKDGSALRDYIHVEDIAEAHLLLFKKMKAGEKLESVYNIGSGAGFTVLEVISSLEKVAEKKLNIINAPRRAGDPAKLVASTEKIKKLGWIPKHTSIEEIISTAWNWHSKNAVR